MKVARIAAAAAVALAAAPTTAAELEYGIEAGIGHSDNIERVPTGEQKQTMWTTGLDLAWLRKEGRFHADVDLNLDYVDYGNASFDNEVTGMANADFRMLFVPQRFEWVVTDSFGQTDIDPFAASTPENRENVNYFTTGPDLRMRLGAAGALTLFGRYSATDFEDSNFGDERKMAGLSIGRELSERTKLSFNASTERVEFDDSTAGSAYDRHSAFVRYEVEGARTTIAAEAGYSEIHDNNRTSSTPLIELDVTRSLTERSTLTFRGGIRSSDAATALRAGNLLGSGSGPGRPDQISTTDPFETRHVDIGWQFTGPRTQFQLEAGYEEDDHENAVVLNREQQHYQASATRQITPRFSARIGGSINSTDYVTANADDDETQLGLYLSWNVSGRLFIEPEIERLDRDSSNALTEYEELRYFLRFAWRNRGRAAGGN